MRTSNSLKIIGGVAVAALLVAAQAQATIAYDFPTVNANQNYPSGSLSLGEIFTVNSSINVNQLAAYDNPANGSGIFGGPVSVAIYSVALSGQNITGGSLAVNPLTFSTANPGTLISGTTTREQALSSPVTLGAGTYMIVANNYGGAAGTENNWNRGIPPGGASSPWPSANTGGGLVTYGANYYYVGNIPMGASLPTGASWNYDAVSNPGNTWHPRYMAGNFDFNLSVIPEVPQFAMVGVGLLGLVYIGRYARLRRTMKFA
jgi:hypothetical protein